VRICPQCHASYDGTERFCVRDAAPLVEKQDFLRLGSTVGNYRLLSIIGRGGMGTVYKGEHVYIGKPVAVKILHERYAKYEEAVKRFLREARAASSINHPNIVDVTDFGPAHDGGVYFVMEFLDGQSLEDLIERESPVSLHRAINIVNQIASALAAAHEKKIVHRDLKPENVMLTTRPGRRETIRAAGIDASGSQKFVVEREGTYDFVKVLDFGIAKVVEPETAQVSESNTVAGTIFGTPEYMSPEAAKGQLVDARADVYSLGVIFYDMLTGHVPFEAETPIEVLTKHITEPPLPPRLRNPKSEITDAAETLIMKALSKNPDGRQQSMDELRGELQHCYGSVAYRRDAYRIPGARESGVLPRLRRLTEELDEWLRQNSGQLAEAEKRLTEIAAHPETAPTQEMNTMDWDDFESPVLEAGGDDAPLLLTKKKKRP
jgi:eukaryotic-like serine/threonine-protein kinase